MTESSPFLRCNIPDPGRMRRDVVVAEFEMHALLRRRLCLGTHARSPLFDWPDRPWRKTAAAVRADIAELVLGAVRAERALIAADPRFHCIRRQIPVAIFAVRSKLQRHGPFPRFAAGLIMAKPEPVANAEFPSISDKPRRC